MEPEVDHDEFENEEQFWDALEKAVSQDHDAHSLIDDALRSYLSLIISSRGKYVDSNYDLGRCSYKLACSPLFTKHADYVRRQFIHCLLQEEDMDILLAATSFLLADARSAERTFELLNEEGAFPRLVNLIASPKEDEEQDLHRLFMELLYEMARIQKISLENLGAVGDDFVQGLFDIIEQVSDDVNDPYHYPVIRVLLVLNEQFMVAAHDPDQAKTSVSLTNKVIKVLSTHGSKYKTFGENIILLLNREDETSLQLLTLKLLYLLFTTPPTYEYFYTNDLRVLVDILIRNLLDLPEEASALRHTYLRVLYPLLDHTQLQHPPHYKKEEIRKLLIVLGGGQVSDSQDGHVVINHWSHFDDVDETTKRLVKRCQGVSWLVELEIETPTQFESPTEENISAPTSPVSPTKSIPPAVPAPRKLQKRESSKSSTLTVAQYLTPRLESARQSSISMMEMATQREKPGVITPSRNPSMKHGLRTAIINKKEKPPLPQARRSGTRSRIGSLATDSPEQEENPADGHEDVSMDKSDRQISAHMQATIESPESKPKPLLSQPVVTKPIKPKPPPTPRARRWRGKRTDEPGKFDARLPSVTTNYSREKIPEISPFSPVEDKTLAPTLSRESWSGKDADKDGDNKHQRHTSSVSEALGQAQAEAINDITETLEKATVSSPTEISPSTLVMSQPLGPVLEKDETENTSNKTDQPHGEQTPTVPNQSPKSPRHHDHHHHQQHKHKPRPSPIKPPPRAILAPPNNAPPRPVPGPEMEVERSPFLSDAEDAEEIDPLDTTHGHNRPQTDHENGDQGSGTETSGNEWDSEDDRRRKAKRRAKMKDKKDRQDDVAGETNALPPKT